MVEVGAGSGWSPGRDVYGSSSGGLWVLRRSSKRGSMIFSWNSNDSEEDVSPLPTSLYPLLRPCEHAYYSGQNPSNTVRLGKTFFTFLENVFRLLWRRRRLNPMNERWLMGHCPVPPDEMGIDIDIILRTGPWQCSQEISCVVGMDSPSIALQNSLSPCCPTL